MEAPGLAMREDILEENGQVLHRSTYQALTQDKWNKNECKVIELAMVGDLAHLGMEKMPQYEPHGMNHKIL